MLRAVGMALEPVEHLVLDIGRNAGTGIADAEYDVVLSPLRSDDNLGIPRGKSDSIGEQIVQHLNDTPLLRDKISDIGIDIDLQLDPVANEPVMDTLRRRLDDLLDVNRA